MTDKKCCILLNLAQEHTLTGDATAIIRLVPGQNVLDADTVAKVRKGNNAFKQLEASGDIKILSGDTLTLNDVGQATVNISQLSVKDAKMLIDTQFDISALKSLLDQEKHGGEQEGRKGVTTAINDRIEAIMGAKETK